MGRDRRGKEVLLEVWKGWESFPEFWEWSGGPPAGSGDVRRPSQRVGRGRNALLEGREESGGTSGDLGGIGRAGSGRQALQEGREDLRGPPEGSRGVGRHSWRAGRGWETVMKGREGLAGPT